MEEYTPLTGIMNYHEYTPFTCVGSRKREFLQTQKQNIRGGINLLKTQEDYRGNSEAIQVSLTDGQSQYI